MNFLRRVLGVAIVMLGLVLLHAYIFAGGEESIPNSLMGMGVIGMLLAAARYLPSYSNSNFSGRGISIHEIFTKSKEDQEKFGIGFQHTINIVGLVGFIFMVIAFTIL